MGRPATTLSASIADTVATMNGPEIFWGSAGVLEGHEESDLKGYQEFKTLAAALKKEGIDLADGEYTLLAPPDTAFEKHNAEVGTPITADVLKYHVIKGKKTLDQLNEDQPTLQGGTLTSYRKFRKNWLDYAVAASSPRAPPRAPTGRRTWSATTGTSTP